MRRGQINGRTARVHGAAQACSFALVAGLVPSLALAEAPTRVVRPVPSTVQPALSADTSPNEARQNDVQGTRRIFVNFHDDVLLAAPTLGDDATRNFTAMSDLSGSLKGFGGTSADREAVLQAVRADWDRYDVVVTDRRPATGDYVMNHVGPNRPESFADKILGIAHLDCGDAMMRNDVSFSFHHAGDGHSPTSVAMTISQEVAHAFGLEHVEDPSDIMYPSRSHGDPSFLDSCAPVVPAPDIGIACTQQHLASCGAPDRQNAHRELLSLLGPARPDEVPPLVRIAMDFDVLHVMPGESFELAVEAHDDVLVDRVILHLDGEPVAEDAVAPFGWKLDDLEPGTYEFYAEALDFSGNAGFSEPITVYVGIDPPLDLDIGRPYATADDIGVDPSVGCGCTMSSDSPRGLSLLLLLPLVLRRRSSRA